MRPEVRNRVTMLGEPVVAEAETSNPGRRRWMLITPDVSGGLLLVQFENRVELGVDSSFGPDEILDRTMERFGDLDQLIESLASRGLASDRFDAPWNTDYPL